MDRRHIRQSAIKYKLPSLEEDPIEGIECRWLPFAKSTKEVKYAAFHGEEPSLKLMPKYREFNNLCYLTSLKTAKRFLEDDAVNTEDVVLRPLRAIGCKCVKEQQKVKAVRFVPNTDDQLKATGMVRTRREPKGLVKFVIAIQGDEGSCSVFQCTVFTTILCLLVLLSFFLSSFLSLLLFVVFSLLSFLVLSALFYSIFLFYIMLCSPLFFPCLLFALLPLFCLLFT